MEQDVSTAGWGFLDRPLFGRRVNWRHVVLCVIILVLLFTRLWDLGNRGYEHDESTHAWESWKLLTGQGYRHDPVYHGPFLYHWTAFTFFLFGTNDTTARLGMAMWAVVVVLSVWPLRRWLGSAGALFSMFLLTISPTMLFRGRFIWHDVVVMAPTLWMLVAFFRYLEDRQERWFYLVAGSLALAFCGKANAFINGFVLGSFLGLYLLVQWLRTRRPLRELAVFDLALLLGTLALPLVAPLVLKALRFNPIDYDPQGLLRIRLVLLVLFVVSAVVGVWWKRRVWLISAGIYYGILLLFHTGFLTNGRGVESGLVGNLGYWLSQQSVARGGQPWYYYFLLLAVYEFLPVLLSTLGAFYYLLVASRRKRVETPTKSKAKAELAEHVPLVLRPAAAGAVALLLYWVLVNYVIFTWSSEKMPWQAQHIVMPLCLLAGWFVGQVWDSTRWHDLRQNGAFQIMALLPVAGVSLLVLLGTTVGIPRPFSGLSLDQLRAALRWVASFLVFVSAAALIGHYGRGQRLAGWSRLVLALVFVILAAVTVRSAWMTAFINQNYASEYLIFAGGTPDTPIVTEEIERLARRFAGSNLKVAYDNESQQPFFWYLRSFPNVGFYTGDSGLPADMHVILVGDGNEAKFKSQLTGRYVRRGYRLIWWPDESTYRNLTLSKLWSDLRDPGRREFWWNIFWWRKYPQSATAWPLVSRFAMYVRRDVASQVWLSGAESSQPSVEVPVDDYDAKRLQLAAVAAWGSYGTGPGQLNNPKGIAVDGQGNVYVADSYNHRVVVFDRSGQFTRQWGSQGNAAGQFQEPWGIAVDATGVVYVADTWNHRIQKFDAQGRFLTQWGSFGDTVGALGDSYAFYGPRQIAVDSDGGLLVSDTGNKRLLKFSADGEFLRQVGGAGSLAGQYLEPVGLVVDAQGNVYVADTWNQRIQKLDANLNYVLQWPILGWESQLPSNKPYLAVDGMGNVYATGPDYHWVIKFDAAGKVSAVWGQFGSDMSSLNVPSGIAVDAEGRAYVLDSGNHRVLQFAPVP